MRGQRGLFRTHLTGGLSEKKYIRVFPGSYALQLVVRMDFIII